MRSRNQMGEYGRVDQKFVQKMISNMQGRYWQASIWEHTYWVKLIQKGEESLKVLLLKNSSGKITVVTQPTDIRDEIALNSALRILAPFLLLVPGMAWLIRRIVRNELAPVKNLVGHIDVQPGILLSPVQDKDIPEEIASFVHAINRLLRRVSAVMEQQRRFVADAAHELRSPLTALSIQA